MTEKRARVTADLGEELERFDAIAKQLGLDPKNRKGVIVKLMDAYKQAKELEMEVKNLKKNPVDFFKALGLEGDEKTQVETALEVSGETIANFVRAGLLMKARTVASKAEGLGEYQNMSLRELIEASKNTTQTGIATLKIQKLVDAVIAYNLGCEDIKDRYYISKGFINEVIGVNNSAINKWFASNAESVNKHNAEMGTNTLTNRGRAKEDETLSSKVLADLAI